MRSISSLNKKIVILLEFSYNFTEKEKYARLKFLKKNALNLQSAKFLIKFEAKYREVRIEVNEKRKCKFFFENKKIAR